MMKRHYFGLVVRFDLKPEAVEDFDQLVEATIRSIKQHEPETLEYRSYRLNNEPNSRLFHELYENREAFEAHEKQPYVKAFLDKRTSFLISEPRVEFFET